MPNAWLRATDESPDKLVRDHLQTPHMHPHPPNADVFGVCAASSGIDCSLEMAYSWMLTLRRSFLSLLDAAEIRYQPEDDWNGKSLRGMNWGY